MRALCWNGANDLRVETVADPQIVQPMDAILRVRISTTCGTDLHAIDGSSPTMQSGDVIGHEFMGEVMESGSKVKTLKPGDRVVVPSFIGCGACWYCEHELWSLCDDTNPKAYIQEPLLGNATAGMYGCTHAFGGYAGAHADYVRVPFADINCFKVPDGVSDEQALFISDAAPTGFMGADFCRIEPWMTVAVWGCGGVGLMAQRSAQLLGADRVIGIDRYPERLQLARSIGVETIDYTEVESVPEELKRMTDGRGPDACIDAAGTESRAGDRCGHALREAIVATRKGGVLSILGVYDVLDDFPIGTITNKGLTVRTARQHGQTYVPRLLEYASRGELNPAILATHRFSLEDAPRAYEMFKKKEDGIVRAVLVP